MAHKEVRRDTGACGANEKGAGKTAESARACGGGAAGLRAAQFFLFYCAAAP